MDGFYYKGLNREEKSAYEQMLAGFKSLAPTIRITRWSRQDGWRFTCG